MIIELFIPGLLAAPGRLLEALQPLPQPLLPPAWRRARHSEVAPGRYGALASWLGQETAPLALLHWHAQTTEAPPPGLALLSLTHARAGMNDLVLLPPALLESDADEREALHEELAAALAPQPQILSRAGSGFIIAEDTGFRSTPLHAAIGHSIRPLLPGGAGSARVNAWMNEMQMSLHAAEVNRQREHRAVLPLNCAWPWGEGELSELPAALREACFAGAGELRLARGLARACDGEFLGEDWNGLGMAADRDVYIIDTRLADALDADDVDSWRARRADVMAHWLLPVLESLRRGEIGTLRLYPGDGSCRELDRGCLRAFWRGWLGGIDAMQAEESPEQD